MTTFAFSSTVHVVTLCFVSTGHEVLCMFHKVSPIFLILFTQLSFLEVFYFIFSRKFLFIVAEIWRKIHEFRILRKKENLRSFREPFFVALASLSISKVAQHTTAQRGEESILNLSFNLSLIKKILNLLPLTECCLKNGCFEPFIWVL